MPEWWMEIDRQDELVALRSLIPAGGCLVLVGAERSGLSIALRVMGAGAERFGYRTYGVSRVKRNTSVKQLLLSAWELVADPPPDDVIRRWRVPGARLSIDQVIDELVPVLRALPTRPALLFDTPDRHDRLMPEEAQAFSELARAAACPIVVASRKESGTRWHAGPGCVVATLADFSRNDVLQLLLQTPLMAGRSLADLTEAVEGITGGAATVAPDEAYSRLYAWSRA